MLWCRQNGSHFLTFELQKMTTFLSSQQASYVNDIWFMESYIPCIFFSRKTSPSGAIFSGMFLFCFKSSMSVLFLITLIWIVSFEIKLWYSEHHFRIYSFNAHNNPGMMFEAAHWPGQQTVNCELQFAICKFRLFVLVNKLEIRKELFENKFLEQESHF